jgi:putative membrane protein
LSPRREFLLLCATAVALALLAAVGCRDLATWAMESAPVFLVAAAAPFAPAPSRLLGRLLFVHGLVLIVGSHWTYAEVPAGNWVRDSFGLARNPYDRLGHLFQGFVPALLVREALLRSGWVVAARAAAVLAVAAALAFSALYELAEWGAAAAIGQAADAFLGTQGDPWDTQADMACALLGALAAALFLRPSHDRSLRALETA